MTANQGQTLPAPPGVRRYCGECALARLCLPGNLDARDVARLDDIVLRRRPLQRDEHLFVAGSRLHAIYVVRAGALKSYAVTTAGDEQVHGFQLPGDLLGVDAIETGVHRYAAVALETTSVCEIPFGTLETLSRLIPALQRRLLEIISNEILADHRMYQALARCPAEERLAVALLTISERLARRGLSPNRFRLPMPRAALGSYLGLAPETMSRLFTRFRNNGWISVSGRELVLHDMHALRQISRHHLDLDYDEPAAHLG